MFRMIVTMGMGMTVSYLKETDEERRVSILHRERDEEEQRTNLVGGHILDQVGNQRDNFCSTG